MSASECPLSLPFSHPAVGSDLAGEERVPGDDAEGAEAARGRHEGGEPLHVGADEGGAGRQENRRGEKRRRAGVQLQLALINFL